MLSLPHSRDHQESRLGIALAGGGSKGAYHVGVLRFLAEAGLEVDAVSGASIGALNGSVVAASANMAEAADRLEEIWRHIANNNPIQVGKPSDDTGAADFAWYLGLMVAMGQALVLPPWLKAALAALTPAASPLLDRGGLCSDAPISNALKRFLDLEALRKGKPFHVSVYRSHGKAWLDFVIGALGLAGMIDTPDSEFLHLQALPESEQVQAILASAAIPLFFKAKTVEGRLYVDGGTGGARQVQGNTPVPPLVSAERCDRIIVCHLSDGSLWSRHEFRNTQIIEIRPGRSISRGSMLGDMVGFDKANILDWMEQGYDDAKRCVGSIADRLKARHKAAEARKRLREKVGALERDGFHVE